VRMTTLLAIFLASAALPPGSASAHRFGHPTVPPNEFLFGVGWANPREQTVFNVEFDSELQSAATYELVFYHNTTDQLAFGLHLYWMFQDLDPLTVEDDVGNQFDVFFDIKTYTLGPRVRYTFTRGILSPYAYAGIGYAFGEVRGSDPDFDRLGYDGFSVISGIGSSILTAEWIDVSTEAFFSSGWASWDDFPFLNSTSRDFDPSTFGVTGSVKLRF